MDRQSVAYGCIVFLALIFADLDLTGIAAFSGPAAAMLLQFDQLRKQRRRQLPREIDASAAPDSTPQPFVWIAAAPEAGNANLVVVSG